MADDDLIGGLVMGMLTERRGVTDQLIGNLQHQLAEAHAEIDAIRVKVGTLLTRDYMPSSEALALALYPSKAEIEAQLPPTQT